MPGRGRRGTTHGSSNPYLGGVYLRVAAMARRFRTAWITPSPPRCCGATRIRTTSTRTEPFRPRPDPVPHEVAAAVDQPLANVRHASSSCSALFGRRALHSDRRAADRQMSRMALRTADEYRAIVCKTGRVAVVSGQARRRRAVRTRPAGRGRAFGDRLRGRSRSRVPRIRGCDRRRHGRGVLARTTGSLAAPTISSPACSSSRRAPRWAARSSR